ncbi:28S ribosomal protein S16, mitochondrial [Aplysia californica]|uniref:Small ribosomal subunit protein bS16m n=1 Tax=Aplysia californica TaxID=6500 RepID=A0ABM1VVA0_APLCA|nr:28S ribosomal protein S16, mitochondrial [Aplysia californica]
MPRLPQRKSFDIIRLALHGCTNRPFYHIVLTKNTRPRDAPPFEQLGTFDSMPNIHNEKLVSLDIERIKYHLANNVALSKPVEKLLGLGGLLPVFPMSYTIAKRNRKKMEAATNDTEEHLQEEDTEKSQ